MPDIQDQTVPYELLVRFGADGAPVGAHVQYLRRITIDGEVVKEDIQPAQSVDLEGFPTGTIMSNATRDALANVDILNKKIAALTAELAGANAQLADIINKSTS